MKITAVRATPVNIPFTAPYRFSYGSIASLTKTVIEVDTDEGVTGLGECADGNRAADVIAAGERLIGLDVRDETGATVGEVTSGGFGPSAGHPVAMGYVDTALATSGASLFADVRGTKIPLGIHPLPFTPHRYRKGSN